MKTVLTIAGSDSSGGAGIQADIKTMSALGVYASSVITALTAQNTTGVKSIQKISHRFVKQQLNAVLCDIFPDAIKIGMLYSRKNIAAVIDTIKTYNPQNIVLDPVLISTSGKLLLKKNSINELKKLFSYVHLVTPNIPEAEQLSSKKIYSIDDAKNICMELSQKYKTSFLIKGGHFNHTATDILFYKNKLYEFKSERIQNKNTHGTGCTLSSAIASYLAKGYSMNEAVELSKKYLTQAIKDGLNIGKGIGPVNHLFNINKTNNI